MPYVLDASVTLAWFFEDEANAYADRAGDALQRVSAVAPSVWPLEVANALLMGERRKRTTEAKATEFLRLLSTLPIVIDDASETGTVPAAQSLARVHGLSVYDAVYLELALRRSLPLATLDRQLQKAAKAAGVRVYTP